MAIRLGNPAIVTDKLIAAYDAKSPVNYTLNEVEVLVVAGGGGGAGDFGNGGGQGGGGAGGLLYESSYKVTPGSGITVTVGNGGAGGTGSIQAARSSAMRGNQGQNSVFGNMVAIGGGGGGADGATSSTMFGGSGGGGGYTSSPRTGGASVKGQGNPGGGHSNQSLAGYSDPFSNNYAGGGGGGAGFAGERGQMRAPGTSVAFQSGGKGGDGILLNISGRPKYYCGGGGGATYANGIGGLGGLGGGGNGGTGAVAPGTPGVSGIDGTGAGGGAGGGPGSGTNVGGNGGNGGKGVVVVRYPGPQKASGGDTIETISGYTIHTFNNSGTFTPLSAPTSNGSAIYGLEDLSGKGHTLLSLGTPTYHTNAGGSVDFTFNSNDRLYTPTKSNLLRFPKGNFTCEFWINMDTNGDATNTYYNLLNIGTSNNNYGEQQLYWNVWRSGLRPGQLYNRINNIASLGYNDPNPKVSGAGWVYVVTKEVDGILSWEYRGGLTHTQSISTPGYPLWTAGASHLILGSLAVGNSAGFYFTELRIYDKALSDSEIDQNYNATKGRYGY
jgi:hypothetical protein